MIYSIEAEQAVIGTLLMEGSLYDTIHIQEDHFYDSQLKRVFRAIAAVADKGLSIDVVTVVSDLGEDVNNVGGVAKLTDLATSIPSTETLPHYEQLVMEAYRKRKTREAALRYAENPEDDALVGLIAELENLQTVGVKQQEMTTYDYLQKIAEDMASPSGQAEKGFPTGYSDLDRMTGGTQPSDLIIIAARPSVGKTAFALNIGSGHCRNGGATHIFSLEMGTEQLLQRMISAESNVDGQKWRSMDFSVDDYNSAIRGIGEISNWDLNIHEETRTVNDIKATVRKEVTENPEQKHLVIIDYLQLMTATGKYERRDLEVGAMTRELKLLARELNIPIVLLSQLSRGVEQRQDKRPMMSDLRESGNIEQDADVIGFLYRDDYYDRESEKQNIIEIILSKQRNGPTGTVDLAFLKEYGKFVNLARDYKGVTEYG
jgi:replicative DNA helicase